MRRSVPALVDRTTGPPQCKYPTWNRAPSSKLQDFWTLVSETIEEPLDFRAASLHTEWKDAINKEIDSILKNNTWDVIDRPSHRKPIAAKWLFKIKKDTQGRINKLKAQLGEKLVRERGAGSGERGARISSSNFLKF